jgi:protocatechuate 3,4-dioxygenase beta subunit
MRPVSLLLAFLICTCFTFASAQTAPVKGRVLDAKGKPVVGAHVTLAHLAATDNPDVEVMETADTDASGGYTFTKPLVFLTPNGTDYSDRFAITVADDSHAPGWSVIAGSDEPGERDIVLEEPAMQQIQVLSADGDPLEGASICVISAGDTQDRYPGFRDYANFPAALGVGLTKTDAAGNAQVRVPRTRQWLKVSHEGFASEKVYLDTAPQKDPLSVHLFPAGSVKGKVTDPDGKPLAGVTVNLQAANIVERLRVKTDAQGQYECYSLRPNSAPNHSGMNYDYVVYLEDPRYCAPAAKVRAESGQVVENIDFAADAGTLVRVKVIESESGNPVSGASIDGWLDEHRVRGFTDARGIIEWRALSGDGGMSVDSPPAASCYVGNFSPQRFNVSGEQQEITLEVPKLQPLVNLRGRVVDAGGKGLASIKVMIGSSEEESPQVDPFAGPVSQIHFPRSSNTFQFGTVTRLDGTFIVKGFPVGRHLSIYAETRNHHSIGMLESDVTEGLKELNPPITLSDAGSADFDLSAAAGIDARNMAVEVAPMVGDYAFKRYARTANVDSEGHLKIGGILPGMKYHVQQRQAAFNQPAGFQYDGELIPKQ